MNRLSSRFIFKDIKELLPPVILEDTSLIFLIKYLKNSNFFDIHLFFSIYSDLKWQVSNKTCSMRKYFFEYWMSLDHFLIIPEVKARYKFMEDSFNKHMLSDPCGTLDYPLFETKGLNFDQVLEIIFKCEDISKYKKRMGRAIEQYGTRVLNNLYILREFTDIKENIDQILAFDHSKFAHPDYKYLDNIDVLSQYIELEKLFNLLCSDEVRFSSIAIKNCIEYLKILNQSNIKKISFKKCKTWKDVQDRILSNIDYARITNFNLITTCINQIQNKIIDEYIIEIPKTSTELVIVSNKLKNCLYFYPELIKAGNNISIIFLIKNNEIKYIVEIKDNKASEITDHKNKNYTNSDRGKNIMYQINKLLDN